jgi:DNA-directed RNA polymerase specialized sigma24 family protein
VDEALALARLPDVYAAALRLRGAGADDQAIAEELGMEREAVEPLLRVAVAKLDALMAQEDVTA